MDKKMGPLVSGCVIDTNILIITLPGFSLIKPK